ncbi:MAG: ADP-ribosylglycohydrolase family protein [Eubacteriales bacterium]|jgi:ADP-ribosylglycohydrolase
MGRNQTYLRYAPTLLIEWEQLKDEGRAVDSFRKDCEALVNRAREHWTLALDEEAVKLAAAMQAEVPVRDHPFVEPSSLDEIRAARPAQRKAYAKAAPDLGKLRAAWAGRIAGCLLGKPVEGLRRKTLYPILREAGNYPMTRYIRRSDYDPARYEALSFNPDRCWADTLDGWAPVDDDTNYTTVALKLLETCGRDFTPADVVDVWTDTLPMNATCTAERVAYRNMALCLEPPMTATYRNPYREWIGAQIRADLFGYVNPGDPETAAEYAWRDACISHVKNGIYGEMWVAAMLAAAAVTDDADEILDAGLSQIPEKSRLYRDVGLVRGLYREGVPAEEIIERIHQAYDEHTQHGWCHTNSNAMIVTMALLCGGWNFGRSVCLAVQAAFDTDCNGATVGSIVGMRNGSVPEEWTAPFAKGLRTSLVGFGEMTLDELAQRTANI